MKATTELLQGLGFGLAMGLAVGFYMGLTFNNDNVESVSVENMFAQQTASTVMADNVAASQEIKITNTPIPQDKNTAIQTILLNIKHQKIDLSINALLFADLSLTQKQLVNNYLHTQLIQLANQKSWSLLREWLSALDSAGLAHGLYYRLQAQLLISQGQHKKALESLVLAKSMVNTAQEQDLLLTEAQQLIDYTVNFFNNGGAITVTQISHFLNYAKQQFLEYIPVSLALANMYRSQGDIQKALDSLAFLPFDENYISSVEALEQQLLTALSQIENNQKGIALIKSGSQFLVKVQVDNLELTLMLDTGASYTAFTEQAIEKISEQTGALSQQFKTIKVNTANGTTTARVFKLSNLMIDHTALNDLSVLEVNMGQGARADGLLGMNYLSQFSFKIDQDSGVLFLAPRK